MTEPDTRTMFVVMKGGFPIFVTHLLDLALKAQVENETAGSPCTIVPVTPAPSAPAAAPEQKSVQMELDLDFDDHDTNPDFLLGRGPRL